MEDTFAEQNISMKVQPFSREWIMSFKDPRQLWSEHWFAVVVEVVSAAILFQVFRNAKKNNTQSAYLILTAICSAICFEMLPLLPRPGYQLWWYHQGILNVLKQRVPSYIITVYALVHYMAHGLTSKSNLPSLTRSMVTAVCGTLIMFPFLWFAPRLLLLFLHFDDAVFKDQIAGVPYIQIIISMLLFFHTSHLFHQNYISIETQERNTYSYIKCALQSGLVSAMYTYIEQYLLFILLNLTCQFNTGVCLAAAILILGFLAKDELKEMQMTSVSFQGFISPLMRKQFWIILVTLLLTASLPLWLNTRNLRSSSDKLEMGPCNINHEVANTSPIELPRRRYVCPEDATRLHFDFHCLPTEEINHRVANRANHYTVCGKNFENPSKIFKIFAAYSAGCITLFYAVMLFSFHFKVQEEKIAEICKKVE